MKKILGLFIIFLFFLSSSILHAKVIQTETIHSMKLVKVKTKLTSIVKLIKKITSSQHKMYRWLFTMIERDFEPKIDIKEKEALLYKLSNTLYSIANLEEALDWFKPRELGLYLYHNDIIGLGVNRTDNGIHFVSLFDLQKGIEFLNNSNTSLFQLIVSSGKDSINLNNESGWNSTMIQWNKNDTLPSLTLKFKDPENSKLKGFSVICQVEFHNNFTNWTFETILPEKGLSLLYTEFPTIKAGPIGETPESNVLHYPKASGVAVQSPYNKAINYSEVYPNWKATYQMLGLYDK